ncbi:transcriptional regulator, ArsR family [Caloranaerobacter azorensis DSM 13643]|uniref:Transcriptional regulator, ArsR family n=1 Tax=Caloranaerobacter azorensis DSM 13643 TaxID=1121264 RepID=A0A1M5T8F7_9FIRM|nr:metalloregulator ArsR/SmtB family transcription factor [Caloranaerobacter azorensis]SHH47057.1 transcriptional regulator, ArsR family [Caloranaerobacter azorensis DSM 13643]
MDKTLEVLKAISDEKRFNIINLLLQHNFCVRALAKRLNLSEAAISQHLKVLREAGLVKGEKKGYYTHYAVNRDILYELSESLKEMAKQDRL